MAFDHAILRRDGLVIDFTHAGQISHPGLVSALSAMAQLEAGAIANADEGRQVGHYWLRDPQSAPTPAQTAAILDSWERVQALDAGHHTDVLQVGIGGSALGPQMVWAALAQAQARPRLHFLDNTDPAGFDQVLDPLDPRKTLVVVASKSGGTVETMNGLQAAQAHWGRHQVPFGPSAIAVTGQGSRLDRMAAEQGWQARLPMWDWVGGRTSITATVGLVPMQLCGHDWRALLAGAAEMDQWTRAAPPANPAACLAAAWFHQGRGRGERSLVVLPYRDQLALVGRYLQQLLMESLGKRLDRQGRVVHQGLAVYGNKGSTDQHAFVQQVRDGRDDVFAHFIDTTEPQAHLGLTDGSRASDHLLGFSMGTESALTQAGRPSLRIRLPRVDAKALGGLIALFERAVGLYAELIDINAYNQPGVEAGKKAAKQALATLQALAQSLDQTPRSAEALALQAGADPRSAWRLLHHLAATGRAMVSQGPDPRADRFSRRSSP